MTTPDFTADLDKAETFKADLDKALLTRAYQHISHSPEERAAGAIDAYAEMMATTWKSLAVDTPELREAFVSFRAGMAILHRLYYEARARIASPMIVGPAKFNHRRNQRRILTAGKLEQKITEYRKRCERSLNRIARPENRIAGPEQRPIRAEDADALERLEARITSAKRHLEIGRSVATRLRKANGKADQLRILQNQGLDAETAEDLLRRIQTLRGTGIRFERLAGEIYKDECRLEALRETKAKAITTQETTLLTIEFNPPDNRIRITFKDRPDRELARRLKIAGYRYAPSLKCWSAFHTAGRANAFARELLADSCEPGRSLSIQIAPPDTHPATS